MGVFTILPQIPAVPACVAHVPAVLADVSGVVADLSAIAAHLAAVVADFFAVLLHVTRVLGRQHSRRTHGERQYGEDGDKTSHMWSRLRFADMTLVRARC